MTLALIGMVLAVAYVIVVHLIWKHQYDKKVTSACYSCWQKYDIGITTRDTTLMYDALFHMTHVCPHASDKCHLEKKCYECEKPLGFRHALEDKYGGIIKP